MYPARMSALRLTEPDTLEVHVYRGDVACMSISASVELACSYPHLQRTKDQTAQLFYLIYNYQHPNKRARKQNLTILLCDQRKPQNMRRPKTRGNDRNAETTSRKPDPENHN